MAQNRFILSRKFGLSFVELASSKLCIVVALSDASFSVCKVMSRAEKARGEVNSMRERTLCLAETLLYKVKTINRRGSRQEQICYVMLRFISPP